MKVSDYHPLVAMQVPADFLKAVRAKRKGFNQTTLTELRRVLRGQRKRLRRQLRGGR
jgi:hypothetical protein